MSLQNRFASGAMLAGVILAVLGQAPQETKGATGRLTAFTSPAELDLTGNFSYAINVGGSEGATVSGVAFQAEASEITGYENTMSPGAWAGTPPEFGDSSDADNLETILRTITFHDTSLEPASQINLAVTSGERYRLQLLFWKAVGPRSFDVKIEGELALDEFNPSPLGEDVALVYTQDLVAGDNQLNLIFEPGTSTVFHTHHPILNALTLERITLAPVPGDANGDNVIDTIDAAILADHWGKSGLEWQHGDFNGDGSVNAVDAAILAAHWSASSAEATQSVPEPLGIVLLLQAILLPLVRRTPGVTGQIW